MTYKEAYKHIQKRLLKHATSTHTPIVHEVILSLLNFVNEIEELITEEHTK